MRLPDTIFIFGLALVIFGPKKLPEIGRQLGKLVLEFRHASNEFKMHITTRRTQEQFFTWGDLLNQLGAEYDETRIRDFRAKVKGTMGRMYLAFPAGLKYELDREGITFLP